MPKKIEDLRDHLFATLEALRNKENPMELNRARAVAAVAQVVIDSARVEVELAKVTGARVGSGFIPELPSKPGTPEHPRLVKGDRS